MELFAGFVLDCVRVCFEAFDLLTQLCVLLLNVFDLFLQVAVFGALLLPDRESILAVDHMTHQKKGKCYGHYGSSWTPGSFRPVERALARRNRHGFRYFFLGMKHLVLHRNLSSP